MYVYYFWVLHTCKERPRWDYCLLLHEVHVVSLGNPDVFGTWGKLCLMVSMTPMMS